MNIKLYIFIILTFIQLFSINIIFTKKYQKYHNYFIVIGLIAVISEFLIFYNLLGYSYGEDLIEYARWFQSTINIYDINQIDFDSKDVGFTYLLYGLSFFTQDTSIFFMTVSIYVILFLLLFFYINYPKGNKQDYLYYLLFFLLIILLNRFFLGNAANTIRSFISATFFLLFIYALYKRQYYIVLLAPFIFLVHKLQFMLFLISLIASVVIPFKYLRIIVLFAIINLFLGYTTVFLQSFLETYMTDLHEVYNSTIIADVKLSSNLLIQHVVLIIIPFMIIFRNITINKFTNLDNLQQILTKWLFFIISFTYILIEVTPRATRLFPIGLILLYFLFVIYSTKKEKQVYINFLIILNFLAIKSHLGDLVI